MLGVLLVAFDGFGQDQADAPTYGDGQFWQFKVARRDWITRESTDLAGDYEVSYAAGAFKAFQLTEGQKIEFTQNADQLRRMLGIKEYALQFLQFPLFVSKKWDTDYQLTVYGWRNTWWTAQTRVTGIQDVTTAAGTFRAFKIDRDFDIRGRACWVYNYWYSPRRRVS